MTTTNRDFAAEYLAACLEARSADTLSVDRRKCDRIARAADKAGVELDEIGLDEQARLALYPAGPRKW